MDPATSYRLWMLLMFFGSVAIGGRLIFASANFTKLDGLYPTEFNCTTEPTLFKATQKLVGMQSMLLIFTIFNVVLSSLQALVTLLSFSNVIAEINASHCNLILCGINVVTILAVYAELLYNGISIYKLFDSFSDLNMCYKSNPLHDDAHYIREFIQLHIALTFLFVVSVYYIWKFCIFCANRITEHEILQVMEQARSLQRRIQMNRANERLLNFHVPRRCSSMPPTYDQAVTMADECPPPTYESLQCNIPAQESTTDNPPNYTTEGGALEEGVSL